MAFESITSSSTSIILLFAPKSIAQLKSLSLCEISSKAFKSPLETEFNLPGKEVLIEMNKIIEKLYNEKIIRDHGVTVAKELAHVLSGGDTTIDKILSEDDLFKLELDAFMKLIETKETQDRIKHTLSTGKPLIN